MKSNSEICDIIQFSVSDKFDSEMDLSQPEYTHIEECIDCKLFYDFVHADSFQTLASHSADEAFDIEQVCQTAAIMEHLQLASPKRKSKIISIASISLATAAAAAVAAITISSQLQPGGSPATPAGDVAVSDTTVEKKLTLPTLSLPEIKLEEKYTVINDVVEDKLETVSYSIKRLRACFIEGNAFLDQYTQDESDLAPESRFKFGFSPTPAA